MLAMHVILRMDLIIREVLNNNSLSKKFIVHVVLSRSKTCIYDIIDKAQRYSDISNEEQYRFHVSVKMALVPLRVGAGAKRKLL